jgi:fatty-acyl-CoA synthase
MADPSRTSASASHVRGACIPPLLADPIGRYFATACRRWADRPLLIASRQGVRKTYREVGVEIERLTANLLARGLRPGDRLAIWSRNRYEWVIAQLAAARAGLVLVAVNPAYRENELEYALRKVGCRALILPGPAGSDDHFSIFRRLAPEIDAMPPGRLRTPRLPRLRMVCVLGDAAAPGAIRFTELSDPSAASARRALGAVGLRPEATLPAAIQFTSGTTGTPKAATLSHANLLNNGFFIGETLRLTERDRICVPVQLYHSFGLVAGILAAITHGAAVVLPGERFAPEPTLHAISAERCTAVIGVPTMFLAMMDHPRFADCDLSSLRTGIMSCSPCPTGVMRRAIAQMNLREITVAYGMTETSPVSFQSSAGDPIERRIETVGHIHPHLEAKVVDPSGRTLPVDQPGELMVRGYALMLGYWADRAATRKVVDADGWIHTGDLAAIDREGYCRIVGRMNDIINRGGENIAPREIEELLWRHPRIAEAYVFGVPDNRFGEEVCAWIRLRGSDSLTAREVRAFCRVRIANSKVPRYIKFVDTFPVTATGKVQKHIMREQSLAELRMARPGRSAVVQ